MELANYPHFLQLELQNQVCAFDATYESLEEGRKLKLKKIKLANINFI